MKRFSTRRTIYLCLPLLLAGTAAVSVRNMRERERAFYSHPFAPQLQFVRGHVPRVPGLFEAEARCGVIGGQGQARWLLRGRLFDLSGKTQQLIWSTDEHLPPERMELISHTLSAVNLGVLSNDAPSSLATFSWRFSRNSDHVSRDAAKVRLAKFFIEVVAIPSSTGKSSAQDTHTTYSSGEQSINVEEATKADITAAKYLPGAQYFNTSLMLDARDDSKYL